MDLIGLRDSRQLAMHCPAEGSNGRTVVLCHPAPGSGAFDPDPEATRSRGVTLLSADRPGYGSSDPAPPGAGGFAAAAADLADALDQLGTGPVGLAGWSAGGLVALALAARRPDLVNRLVLIATPAPDDQVPWIPAALRQSSAVPVSADPDRWIGLLSRTRPGAARSGGVVSGAAGSAGVVSGVAGSGVAGSGGVGLGVAGSGVAGSGGVGLGVAGSGVARSGGAGSGAGGSGVDGSDVAALGAGDVRLRLKAMLHEAFRQGEAGLAADRAAVLGPWGFDPGQVAAKTLLLYGAKDPIAGPRHGKWYQPRLQSARYEQSPNTGHLIILSTWRRALAHLAPGAKR
jgi:pimeloyl-ACP methyl ester carboxylesterase